MRVPLLAVHGATQPDALAFDRLDQRGRHAAPIGELLERQELVAIASARGGHRGRQVRVGRSQLALHHPADRGERQPLALQRPDLADPLGVLGAVPGHSALADRSGKQPERLVVADRVDGDVARSRELFHPVPHDQPLYECSLARSTRPGRATMPRVERASRPVSLLMVLMCLLGTLVAGVALKAPCAGGDWADGRQYTRLCYSDIVPLLDTEQLVGGRLPFLQPCLETGGQCDEYPVLTMYFMRAAGWIGGEAATGFFMANVLLLWVCAAAIATCLYMLGGKPLWFALAPTLIIYGFMNWDLFAVAFATGGLLAFARRRDGWAGILLGLGAAAKFYPALLLIPLIAARLHDREPDGAIRIGWSAAGTWVLVNLPFAVASPSSWWEFFRFNSARPADWDSLWYIGCEHVHLSAICGQTARINALSLAIFIASFAGIWVWKARREPGLQPMDAGVPHAGALPALQQGLLAAVRPVAPAVLRARVGRPAAVRGVRGRRHRRVHHAVLVLRTALRFRRPAVRRVRDRDRRADAGPGVVPGHVGAATRTDTRHAGALRRRRPRAEAEAEAPA